MSESEKTGDFAVLLDDRIVSPIKKRFSVLEEKNEALSAKVKETEKNLSSAEQETGRFKHEMESNLSGLREELKYQKKQLDEQMKKLEAIIAQVEKNSRCQQNFEDALSDLKWEE